MGTLRERMSRFAEGVSFAGGVLNKTGLLSALSPRGVVSFARVARGIKPGPHAALMLHAANKPEKTAIVEGTRRRSYGELDGEVNQLAHALVELGVKPGGHVALMLPNSAQYLIAQQALSRIGGTSVQIGYRLKAAEVAFILKNAAPTVVLVHRDYAATMTEARRTAGLDDGPAIADGSVIVTGLNAEQSRGFPGHRYETLLERFDARRPPVLDSGEDTAGGVIIYTSGTTGKPKGAKRSMGKVSMDAIGDFMRTVGLNHDDVHLVVCPLYHSAAPAFAGMMLTLGATVVIAEQFDAESILRLIERERVTCAFMVPTMLVRLCQLEESVRRRHDTSSLRWILSGAAPLATETAKRFQEQFGHLLWNFYGATETGLVTLADPYDHEHRPGTVGRLLRGNEVRLLDDNGNEVALGEVGEIYVRNGMLISGYHNNSNATSSAQRDGFFSVGDLARADADGFLYLESRKHDMVISGGVNIYPREIEDHLHTHSDILQAAVIGVPDDEWGESLKAFVVTRPQATLREADVIEYCRAGLADYKRPRSVEFLDELPHNPTGKIMKRQLRERSERAQDRR